MKLNRSPIVFGILLGIWILIILWQVVEHSRVRSAARQGLTNRARDISGSLGVLIRSQRRFGLVTQPRLESALNELLRSEELLSVALLNSSGEVVASAGSALPLEYNATLESGVRWETESVTLVNLVDLGQSTSDEGEPTSPTIVIPSSELEGLSRTNRSRRSGGRRGRPPETSSPEEDHVEAGETNRANPRVDAADEREESSRRRRGRSRFGRPPWMSHERYQELIEKQGLHGFVIVMSTAVLKRSNAQDLWLRSGVGFFALLAVVGLSVAWQTKDRSSALQIRLLRAKEMNDQLRQMNVAAAGLAHETRNPLNLIRGFAQMISKNPDAPEEIRSKSGEITEEVDRVTHQLNEFINYSKPREVRLAPVKIKSVIRDIARALETDLADQEIEFELTGPELHIEADERQLRQALFNLIINAIQAVDHTGRIEMRLKKSATDTKEAIMEIHDSGPGVPEEHRSEIFYPYFTTRESGSGLGLAVVHQIVLAHGWEIEYVGQGTGGATFRISGLRLR